MERKKERSRRRKYLIGPRIGIICENRDGCIKSKLGRYRGYKKCSGCPFAKKTKYGKYSNSVRLKPINYGKSVSLKFFEKYPNNYHPELYKIFFYLKCKHLNINKYLLKILEESLGTDEFYKITHSEFIKRDISFKGSKYKFYSYDFLYNGKELDMNLVV